MPPNVGLPLGLFPSPGRKCQGLVAQAGAYPLSCKIAALSCGITFAKQVSVSK